MLADHLLLDKKVSKVTIIIDTIMVISNQILCNKNKKEIRNQKIQSIIPRTELAVNMELL